MKNSQPRKSAFERIRSLAVGPSKLAWSVGIIAALLALGIPMVALSWRTSPSAELRLAQTEGGISGWVIAGQQRLAFINTSEPAEARALRGRLARPWEAEPTILVASAADSSAAGIWETIQDSNVQQILVAGIPGSNPTWHSIERESDARGISLVYIERWSSLQLGDLTATIVASNPDLGTNATLQIRTIETQVALALSEMPPSASGDLIVTAGAKPLMPGDTLLTTELVEGWVTNHQILFQGRDIVNVRFTSRGLEIRGADPVSAVR